MSAVVKVPRVTANEETVTVAAWTHQDGDLVRAGDVIAAVETTKATLDVEAPASGFLRILTAEGAPIAVGELMAAILDRPGDDWRALVGEAHAVVTERWTKKAALTAKRLGVDLERLAASRPGYVLQEADVLAAQRGGDDVRDFLDDRYPANRPERVLILGGAGGAGVITIDAIRRGQGQRAVAILDNNPRAHDRWVGGVPILGALDRAEALFREGAFDTAINVITGDPGERARIFDELRAKGVPFTNVIDPAATVRANVSMGTGNLVMANVYLGACTKLGDNNFLASHTCIEHHSTIGHHNTFGPRSTAAGAVVVEDRVKIGMMVGIEPYVRVGSDSVVASGVILTSNVAPRSVVKAQVTHVVREGV